MNYEAVFNIFVGILVLLGWALLIIFWIVFREENTTHPIYRSVRSQTDPNCQRTEPTITNHATTETR
jgi:hypothetical protein